MCLQDMEGEVQPGAWLGLRAQAYRGGWISAWVHDVVNLGVIKSLEDWRRYACSAESRLRAT